MLHPQARALIDLMAERGVPPTHTLTPEAARAAYRDRRALTRHTVTDLDALMARVRQVRQQGWCLVDQELEEGLISLAAPITNRAGETVAALNISGQANRSSARVMQAGMLPALLQAARRISVLLGGAAR